MINIIVGAEKVNVKRFKHEFMHSKQKQSKGRWINEAENGVIVRDMIIPVDDKEVLCSVSDTLKDQFVTIIDVQDVGIIEL